MQICQQVLNFTFGSDYKINFNFEIKMKKYGVVEPSQNRTEQSAAMWPEKDVTNYQKYHAIIALRDIESPN